MNARPRSKFEVNWWAGVGRSAVEFKAVVQVGTELCYMNVKLKVFQISDFRLHVLFLKYFKEQMVIAHLEYIRHSTRYLDLSMLVIVCVFSVGSIF